MMNWIIKGEPNNDSELVTDENANQNDDYGDQDEDDEDEGDQEVNSLTSSGSKKRKNEGSEDIENFERPNNIRNRNDNNKKRFIWPESLHLDFISAVFDIGLKSSSIDEILSIIPSHLPYNINKEELKSSLSDSIIENHIQKYRYFRSR